jgi:hypothetical protein
MIEMTSDLAKIIIEQFFCIVEQTSKRCCICWDKCSIKIVTRLYFDRLVIEIFQNNNCNCEQATISTFMPLPLITIDFTDVKHKNIKCDKWIRYLEIKASELLNKIEAAKGNIIPNLCCPIKKAECLPINNCNCTFREEYRLCPCKPCQPTDKPYDDWCKPCKKPKRECSCYKEPKCPIKHINCEEEKCHEHKKCEIQIKCKPVKLYKCEDHKKCESEHEKCDKCDDHKKPSKCEPIKCHDKCDDHKKPSKCEPIKCHDKCDDHDKCKKKHKKCDSERSDSESSYFDFSSISDILSCSDILSKSSESPIFSDSESDHKNHNCKKHNCKKHNCKKHDHKKVY